MVTSPKLEKSRGGEVVLKIVASVCAVPRKVA
jgi:hypothetical protein